METWIHTPPPQNRIFAGTSRKGDALFLRLRDKLRAGAKSPLSFWERARVRASLGYDILRILLAAVLLTAAVLKTYELATGPVLGNELLDSRWLLMAVVEFELFFGIWLLSGFYPRQTWAAAILCFGIFACVPLYKALAGHASCGCFGPVPINPWYTTAFDAAIVLLLLYWRPRGLSRLSLAVILKGTDGAPCEAWSRLVGEGSARHCKRKRSPQKLEQSIRYLAPPGPSRRIFDGNVYRCHALRSRRNRRRWKCSGPPTGEMDW